MRNVLSSSAFKLGLALVAVLLIGLSLSQGMAANITASAATHDFVTQPGTDKPLLVLPSPELAVQRLQMNPNDPHALASLARLQDEEFTGVSYPVSRTQAIVLAGGIPTKELWLASGLMPFETKGGVRIAWAVRKSRFEAIAVDVTTGEILGEINFLNKNQRLLADVLKLTATQEGVDVLVRGYNPMLQPEDLTTLSDWNQYVYVVYNELVYALSLRRDGTSSIDYAGNTMGDWDYHGSNVGVTNEAQRYVPNSHPAYTPGTYGSILRDTKRNITYGYQGGYCKFFAACIIRRATGFAWIPSGYTYGFLDGRDCWVGDVLQKPSSASPHTAIVIQVLAMDDSGSTVVDLVDSNYIGGNGRFLLGRHDISCYGSGYADLDNYRVWYP